MKMARLVLSVGVLFAVVGCADRGFRAPYPYPERADRERVWKAMHTVLTRNGFLVQTSRYTGTDMVATSRVHSEGFQKYRMKVTARVALDEDDFPEPIVRVVQQVDVSDPDVMTRGTIQPRYQWRNVGFHEAMEAQLRNEIEQELYGRSNPFDGKFFRSHLPKERKEGAGGKPQEPALRGNTTF